MRKRIEIEKELRYYMADLNSERKTERENAEAQLFLLEDEIFLDIRDLLRGIKVG